MKIAITIILVIATFLEMLNAQYMPLVEESKYWIYYDFQARPRPTTGFLITIKGDTILNSKLYKKVYKYELSGELKNLANNEPLQFVADFPYKLKEKELISFLREDIIEKLVYNLPINKDSCLTPSSGNVNPCNDIIFCDTIEHLLFDFSLQTNDTLNYCCFAPLHYNWEIRPKKVDSIKYEMHFGKYRNTFYTIGVNSYLPNFMAPGQIPESQVKIIEGVGFKHQGLFNYRFGNLVDYCEGELNSCNIISSIKEISLSDSEVVVFPNPTTGHLKFDAKHRIAEISLLSSNSVELVTVKNETQLDINNLPVGIYICKIKLENGSIINKKVIKLNP